MPERKYALRRIGKGDYLLPSNDRRTIWRLRRYSEDGSAEVETFDGKIRRLTGSYWALYRYTGRSQDAFDIAEWSEFECYDTMFLTRAQAIAAALKTHS